MTSRGSAQTKLMSSNDKEVLTSVIDIDMAWRPGLSSDKAPGRAD